MSSQVTSMRNRKQDAHRFTVFNLASWITIFVAAVIIVFASGCSSQRTEVAVETRTDMMDASRHYVEGIHETGESQALDFTVTTTLDALSRTAAVGIIANGGSGPESVYMSFEFDEPQVRDAVEMQYVVIHDTNDSSVNEIIRRGVADGTDHRIVTLEPGESMEFQWSSVVVDAVPTDTDHTATMKIWLGD